MNVKFLNPFVEAAFAVIEAETGITAQRGPLTLSRSAITSDEVTLLISMVGQVRGIVLYSLAEATAVAFASKIMDQPFKEFDDLAQSGICEITSVTTNQASSLLEKAGYEVEISPPTLLMGKGILVSTLDFERLQVPIETELGRIQIDLALREVKMADNLSSSLEIT